MRRTDGPIGRVEVLVEGRIETTLFKKCSIFLKLFGFDTVGDASTAGRRSLPSAQRETSGLLWKQTVR
jgi:hypothetical protein